MHSTLFNISIARLFLRKSTNLAILDKETLNTSLVRPNVVDRETKLGFFFFKKKGKKDIIFTLGP